MEDEQLDVEKGEVSQAQAAEISKRQFYTIRQLAEELCYSIPWITVLVQRQRIKAIKPSGGSWRIPISEVERIKREGVPPLPRRSIGKVEEIEIDESRVVPKKTSASVEAEKPKEKKEANWPLNFLLK